MTTMPAMRSVKSDAIQLASQLPSDATWDDLLYEIYVRQSIDAGIKDCDEGRVLTISEVRTRLGLA